LYIFYSAVLPDWKDWVVSFTIIFLKSISSPSASTIRYPIGNNGIYKTELCLIVSLINAVIGFRKYGQPFTKILKEYGYIVPVNEDLSEIRTFIVIKPVNSLFFGVNLKFPELPLKYVKIEAFP
jgi:hypothetical protein